MIRVFPVSSSGAPHYGDDFGYVRPGASRGHGGIDIFAAEGTPILAVDDGSVEFREDPIGGHAFYLHAADGVVYYGAHLSAYEGQGRAVRAGDVVGYVGQTGNARGTSPHLHFEAHPAGGAGVDPFAELAALLPPSSGPAASRRAPASGDGSSSRSRSRSGAGVFVGLLGLGCTLALASARGGRR